MEDDTTSLCAALFGLAGFEVLAAADAGGELELLVQTTAGLVGCPTCGAVAHAKDRQPTWVRDLPIGGRSVVLCWWKRVGRVRTRRASSARGPSSTRRSRRGRG